MSLALRLLRVLPTAFALLLFLLGHACLGGNEHVDKTFAKGPRAFVCACVQFAGNNGGGGDGRTRSGNCHAMRCSYRTRKRPAMRTTNHCCAVYDRGFYSRESTLDLWSRVSNVEHVAVSDVSTSAVTMSHSAQLVTLS